VVGSQPREAPTLQAARAHEEHGDPRRFLRRRVGQHIEHVAQRAGAVQAANRVEQAFELRQLALALGRMGLHT
jgi:hypothetical protein